jgi:DNA polymerase-3 subunit alpha
VRSIARTPLAALKTAREAQTMAGVVAAVRVTNGRRGRMAIVTLDDGTETREVMVFSEVFEPLREQLRVDAVVVVQGSVRADEFSGGVRIAAEQIWTLPQARAHFAKYVRVVLDADRCDAAALIAALGARDGAPAVPVRLELHGRCTDTAFWGQVDLGAQARLAADDDALRSIMINTGAREVAFVY